MSKIIDVDKDGFLYLSDLDELLDTSKVVYYETQLEGDFVVLKLYDKNKQLIKAKVKDE